MSCPYFESDVYTGREDASQDGENRMKQNEPMYNYYLKLDRILDSQEPLSGQNGLTAIHDEHLFIITHQTFELWFKQILHEINSARQIFGNEYLEERNMLVIISRMTRVVEIMKMITSGFQVMETMTPQDFFDFRGFLKGGSGFQSFQFRMIEIKIGLKGEQRVKYNRQYYLEVFSEDQKQELIAAENGKSLFNLVNAWLERTPGLEQDGFDFITKFKSSVNAMISEMAATADDAEKPEVKASLIDEVEKSREKFQSIFDEHTHEMLKQRGERTFSLKALQGAMMIFLYREEPRFHLPFQLLQCLTDIDGAMTKFRYNHASMVQRMIGNKIGTGGSSGYLYLRSTCSDRYKVFRDLTSLSNYLVPRDRIPPLSVGMKHSLSIHDWTTHPELKASPPDGDEDSGVMSAVTRMIRRVSMSSQGTAEERLSVYRKAGKPESLV